MYSEAVFSKLGTVIRNVKSGLFVSKDGRWFYKDNTQTALFTLLLFTLLLFFARIVTGVQKSITNAQGALFYLFTFLPFIIKSSTCAQGALFAFLFFYLFTLN